MPTVYATLDLLVELGLARKLDLGLGSSPTTPGRIRTSTAYAGVAAGSTTSSSSSTATGCARATAAAMFHADAAELVVTGLCDECYGVNRTVITSPSATT